MDLQITTVAEAKSTFILGQVRDLSRPLEVPEGFADYAVDIPQKAIDTAMREVNRIVRRHNKTAYDGTAIRSIAEQIDSLYWEAGAPDGDFDYGDFIYETDNLTDPTVISRLAEDLSESPRYQALLTRLHELSNHRQRAREKLDRYKAVKRQIDFLKQHETRIQPNLSGKNGPLIEELDRGISLATTVTTRTATGHLTRDAEFSPPPKESILFLSEKERLSTILNQT